MHWTQPPVTLPWRNCGIAIAIPSPNDGSAKLLRVCTPLKLNRSDSNHGTVRLSQINELRVIELRDSRLRARDGLAHLEAFELGMLQVERLVAAGALVRDA